MGPEQRSAALDMLGVSHARRLGPTVLDAPEGVNPIDHLRAVVRKELDRLEARRGDLVELNEVERQRAIASGHDPRDPEVRKFQRYASAALNTVARLDKQFFAGERDGPMAEPRQPAWQKGESDADFRKRMQDYVNQVEKYQAQLSSKQALEFARERERENRGPKDDQPRYEDASDFQSFLEELQEWHAKRTGAHFQLTIVPVAAPVEDAEDEAPFAAEFADAPPVLDDGPPTSDDDLQEFRALYPEYCELLARRASDDATPEIGGPDRHDE